MARRENWKLVWVEGRKVIFTEPLRNQVWEGRITKVGRQYIHVKGIGENTRTLRFDLDTEVEAPEGNYRSNYPSRIYPSRKEYDAGIKLNRNKRLVVERTKERASMLSLSQTERILDIIDENSYYPTDRS